MVSTRHKHGTVSDNPCSPLVFSPARKPKKGQKRGQERPYKACTGHQKPMMARWEPKTDPGETQERPRRAQKYSKRDQDQHISKMCTALRRDANFSKKVRRAAAGTQVLHFLKSA